MKAFQKSKLLAAVAASGALLLLSGCSGSDGSEPEASVNVVLPAECKNLYDAESLNDLQTIVPPLNDPGVGISSTQVPALEEMLSEDQVQLRCTWGSKPDYVIATQIMKVDQEQQQKVIQTLQQEGFVRNNDSYQGVFYARSQQSEFDEEAVAEEGAEEEFSFDISLETHYLNEGVWISSYLNNAIVPGYTESIMNVIWP